MTMPGSLLRLVATGCLAATTLLAQNCPERTLGTALGSGDDVVFAIQPIGFSFPFGGTTYTDVHVCTNGYLQLSNAGTPAPAAADYTSSAAELGTGSPRIAPLWTDLFMDVSLGGVCYVDSTPSRCTITWDKAINYGNVTTFQIQVQLFPNGDVKFFYSAGVINASTFGTAAAAAVVGMSPGLGATLPAVSNLSTALTTPDNSVYETFTGGGFDMPASSLLFVATAPGWTTVPAALSGCATSANYGQGCLQANDSFYELMTAGQFDLAGQTLTMLRQANGYFVLTAIPGAIVPPTTNAVPVAAGDDAEQTVTLSQAMPCVGGTTSALTICSNAHIALSATGNGTSIGPTIPVFLGWANTVVGCIHDYDQTAPGSGLITFEEIGSIAYVTWNNVMTWNTSSADTLQFQFNLTSGDITLVFGTFNPAGNNYLVGYSVGGASLNPGASDISNAFVAGQLITDVPVGPGLALTTSGLPSLGSTNFSFDISNVPNVAPFAILFFGDTAAPGIDLSIIGMPGCRGYTNANLLSLTVPVALPVGTGSQGLAIPGSAILVGTTITTQAAAFSLQTALGLVTSNGSTFTVGY